MKKLELITKGALALAVLPGAGSDALANQALENNEQIVNINEASLNAIEASWLSTPNICKAKNFYADPVIANKVFKLERQVSDLYSAFDDLSEEVERLKEDNTGVSE